MTFSFKFNTMSHTEDLLHYIWKYRLFDQNNLKTTDGYPVEIIDPGLHNSNAGADFFNAKIKINDKMWAGNVEIHINSDDWYKHKHHLDKNYNSVILHVAEHINKKVVNEEGTEIPQLNITISENFRSRAEKLLERKNKLPCKEELLQLDKISVASWLDVLAIERLERKTNDIYNHLDRFNNSWDQTFYVLLSRNFGFGLNSNEFERLALSLQYNIIQKHSNNLFQIEALLFGQAGMLQDEQPADDYYISLKHEYNFLRHKYQLKPLDQFLFKKLRVRPGSFPQIRIAQLSALFAQSGRIFSNILETEDYRKIRLYFQSQVSEYWKSHYTFGKASKSISKYIGDSSLDNILINTVAPILFAYGKKNDQEKYCERAFSILESIKPERNSIISDFKHAGLTASNALDSQAIIQLKKEYCDKKKCLYCKVGYKILSKSRA